MAMHPIWRFVIGLGFAGLAGHLSAAGTGSASGTSETSNGRQQTDFAYPGPAAPSALTPQSAFVDFGPDVEPVGIASNGTITLRLGRFDTGWEIYGTPARWRNGTTSVLQVPPVWLYSNPNAAQDNLHLDFSPETGIGGLSRNGVIAAEASDEIPNGTHFGIDREDFTVVWPGNSDTPSAIKGPVRTVGNDDDPKQINHYSSAKLLAVDNGDGIWARIDWALIPDVYINGNTGGVPAFTASQMGSYDPNYYSPSIIIYDVNAQHQAVGAAVLDNFHFGYFVGAPANWVDFLPFAINDAGQVLGDDFGPVRSVVWPVLKADFYGAHIIQSLNGDQISAPFVSTGSQRQYLQGVQGAGPVRISGFDEAGNVYGSVGASFESWGGLIDPGQNVIWVAKPAEWGLSADTPAYTPIVWAMPTLPAGYCSLYGILPGVRRIELGVASKTEADGGTSTHGFALVPAQLRVDFNRDGVIDASDAPGSPDREFSEKNLPYFFWVNDDDDEGETSGDDIPGQPANRADAVNDHVDGMRDLVDFFPVYLDIKGLLGVLPPSGDVTYKLSHKTGVLGYVPTDLTPATAGKYLRDVPTAKSLANAHVTPISPAGVALPAGFLEQIRTGDKGVILIEASAPTNFPLALEVWKGSDKIATLELPLSISGVESMYRRENLVWAGRMTVEAGAEGRAAAFNYPDELCNDMWFVFVHGYNVNQQQARGGQSEFFKRLWWSGSRAKFVGVTWYGYESQNRFDFSPDYHANVIHAFETAGPMADYLRGLSSDATKIQVAAHSLGNMVASSAICDKGAPVAKYYLLDAAIAAEAYSAAETQPSDGTATMPHTEWTRERGGVYPARLWASQWYALFPGGTNSDARSTLTWQNRFGAQSRGNTVFYDFYSTGEEVLAEHTGNTPSVAGVLVDELGRAFWNFLFHGDDPNGRFSWVYQEKLKGRTITGHVLGSNYGGWGFNTFDFRNAPDTHLGSGPALTASCLDAPAAQALSPRLSNETLQAVPFFLPGDDDHRLESWPTSSQFMADPLGQLYTANGMYIAERHRNRLLAQMIPAMSLAAGRKAVGAFTPPDTPTRNFDMNDMKTGWPAERGNDDKWRHSDLRAVAYVYVQELYKSITQLGALDQRIP
jgi:hypothetical protein